MAKKYTTVGPQHDLLLTDEGFLRDFFENSSVGFHVFGPDKIIQAMNKAELDMLGYTREEIVGKKKWSDLIIPEQRKQFERHWRDISQKGRVTDLRYTLKSKDGKNVEVVLNASARFDGNGALINTRGTVLDIGYFNRSYEMLQSSTDVLKGQKLTLEQHNQALNALLANIEIEKQNIRSSIQVNFEKLILPILKKLRRKGGDLDQRHLDVLEKNFLNLTSSFGGRLVNPQWGLTSREIEICDLIKNGLSTKAIADLLSVSTRTVEHHRDHIRKKFGLDKKGVNLVGFLKTLA